MLHVEYEKVFCEVVKSTLDASGMSSWKLRSLSRGHERTGCGLGLNGQDSLKNPRFARLRDRYRVAIWWHRRSWY